jgi:hypothetical protein
MNVGLGLVWFIMTVIVCFVFFSVETCFWYRANLFAKSRPVGIFLQIWQLFLSEHFLSSCSALSVLMTLIEMFSES